MRWFFFAATACTLLALTHAAQAQHSDIDFKYDGGKIEVEFGPEGRVFESEFPTSGSFEQFTDDPGFGTDAPIGAGDTIDYNILGPLEYHDGNGFAVVPTGAQIKIDDNPTGDLTVTGSTVGPVSGSGVIGQADGTGDLHSHIDFTLEPASPDPPFGAYAILMELTTDATGIANSDSFYIVFNYGLDEPTFEGAVEDFAQAVPEPSTVILALLGCLGLGAVARWRTRRRR